MTSNNSSSSNEYRASNTHAATHRRSNEKSNYVEQFKTIYPGINIDDAFKYIENLDFKEIQTVQETRVKEISKYRPDTVITSRSASIAKRHSNKTESSRNSIIKPDAGRTSELAKQNSDSAETLRRSTPDRGKPSNLAVSAKEHSDFYKILLKLKPDAGTTHKPAIIAKLHSGKSATTAKGKTDNLRSSTPKPGEGNTSKPAISAKQHTVKTEHLSKLDNGNTNNPTISAQENSDEFESSRSKQEKRTFHKHDNCKITSKKHKKDKKMEQDRKVKEKKYETIEKIKKFIQSEETHRKKSRGRPKLTLKDKLSKKYFKHRRSYESKENFERISDTDAGSPENYQSRYHAANATENADTGEAKQPYAMSYATPSNPDEEEDDLIILCPDTEYPGVNVDTEYVGEPGAKGTEESSHSIKQHTNSPLETNRRNTIILGHRKPAVNKQEVTKTIRKFNKNKTNNTSLKKGIDKVIATNANLNNGQITNSVTPTNSNASATSGKQRWLNLKENKGLIGMKIAFAHTEPEPSNKRRKNIKHKKAIHTLNNVGRKKCTVTASKLNREKKTVFESKSTKTPAVSRAIKRPKDDTQKQIRKTYPTDSSNKYGTVTTKLVGIKIHEQQATSPKPIADLDKTKDTTANDDLHLNEVTVINAGAVSNNMARSASDADFKEAMDSRTLKIEDMDTKLTKEILKEADKFEDLIHSSKVTTDSFSKNNASSTSRKAEEILDSRISQSRDIKAGAASNNMARSASDADFKEAMDSRTLKIEDVDTKLTKEILKEADKSEDLIHSSKGTSDSFSKNNASSTSRKAEEILDSRISQSRDIEAGAPSNNMARSASDADFKEPMDSRPLKFKDMDTKLTKEILKEAYKSEDLIHSSKGTTDSVSKNNASSTSRKAEEILDNRISQPRVINAGAVSNNMARSASDAYFKEAMDSRTLKFEDMDTKLTKEILKEADKSEDLIHSSKGTTDLVSKKNASSTSRKAEEILDSRISQSRDINATTATNTLEKIAEEYLKVAEIKRETLDSRISPTKEIRAQPHNSTKTSTTNGLNATTVHVIPTSVKNNIKEQYQNNTTQIYKNENKVPQAHIEIYVNSDGTVRIKEYPKNTTEYPNETPSPKPFTELYRQLTNTPSQPTVIIAPPKPSENKDLQQLNKDTAHENREQQRPIQKHKPSYQQPIRDVPNQSMPLAQKELFSAMGRLQYFADEVQQNPITQNMQLIPNNTFNPLLQPREISPQNTAYNCVKYAAGDMYNIPSHPPDVNRQQYQLTALPPQDKQNTRYTMNDAANWPQSREKYKPTNVSKIPRPPYIVNNHGRQVLPGQPPQNTHNKSSNYALHLSQEKYPLHNVNIPSLPQLRHNSNHNQRQVHAQLPQEENSIQYSSYNRLGPPGYLNMSSPPQIVNNQQSHMLPGQDRHKMPYLSTNEMHALQLREEYLQNCLIKLTQNQTTINNQQILLPGQLQNSHNMGYATSNVLNPSLQQGNYVPANVNITRQVMPAQLTQDKQMDYTFNHALQPQERYIPPNVNIQPMPPLCSTKQCNFRCAKPQSLQNISSNNAMLSQRANNTPNTNAIHSKDFAAPFFPEFTYEPTSFHDLCPPVVNINNNCTITYEEIRPLSPPHRRKRKGTDNENPSVTKRQKPIKDFNPLGTTANKGFSSRNIRALSVEEVNSAADASKNKYRNLAPYGISVDEGPLPSNPVRSPSIAEMNSWLEVSGVENVNSKIALARTPNTSQDGTRGPRYKPTEENEKGTSRVLRLWTITDANSTVDALEKVKPIASSQEANHSSEDNHRGTDITPDSQRHIPNPSTLTGLEVIDSLELYLEKVAFKMESSQEPNTFSEDNIHRGVDTYEDVKFASTVGPSFPSLHSADVEFIDPFNNLGLSKVAPRLNSTTKCDKSKLEDNVIDLTED